MSILLIQNKQGCVLTKTPHIKKNYFLLSNFKKLPAFIIIFRTNIYQFNL